MRGIKSNVFWDPFLILKIFYLKIDMTSGCQSRKSMKMNLVINQINCLFFWFSESSNGFFFIRVVQLFLTYKNVWPLEVYIYKFKFLPSVQKVWILDTYKHGNKEKISIKSFFLFTCKLVIVKKRVRKIKT